MRSETIRCLERVEFALDPAHLARTRQLRADCRHYRPISHLPVVMQAPVPDWPPDSEAYLNGLARLTREVGDRALVLPHHSPAYICACYALGFERAMECMISEPELFRYVCDRHAAGDRLRMREWKAAGAEACFIADSWASCDILPVEIAAAVREQIHQSGPDAPFILSTGSPLVSNIEPDAVDAMIRAARSGAFCPGDPVKPGVTQVVQKSGNPNHKRTLDE